MPLNIRGQDGRTIELESQGQVSPEALRALMTGQAPADAPVVTGLTGEPLRDTATGRQLSPLSADELVAIGAAERDPTTGQLVQPGTGNPLTAERGFDTGIAQREARRQRRLELQQLAESQKDRRQRRRAAQDVDTYIRGFRNGELDISQLSQGMEALRKEYGDNVLLQDQQWRQLTAVDGAYEQAKQEAVEDYAQEQGVPRSWVTWSDEAGGPVRDEVAISLAKERSELAERAAKPALQLQDTKRKMALERYKNNLQSAQTNFKVLSDIDPVQAANRFREEQTKYLRQYQEEVSGIVEDAADITRSTLPEYQTPQAPPAAIPGLPPGKTLVGRFSTAAEAKAAGVRADDYFMLGPYLTRINALGRPERVR